VTYDGDWRETFRPDIPSAARIYDYLLGGKDNYPADRAVGESMIAQLPNVRLAVQWNRAFLRRVVRYLVGEAGIRQIIDVGAGLPTAGNTHEVALAACPQARVVYVDHDPVVLAHARNMLHGVPRAAIVGRDLLEPSRRGQRAGGRAGTGRAGTGMAAGVAARSGRAVAAQCRRGLLLRSGRPQTRLSENVTLYLKDPVQTHISLDSGTVRGRFRERFRGRFRGRPGRPGSAGRSGPAWFLPRH